MRFISGNSPRLFLLLLGGLPLLARAQSGAATRGEVHDAGSATPLPGAVVRWLLPGGTSGPTTTTTGAGTFVLPFPAQASHRLIVSALGYTADTVAVPTSGTPYLRVRLKGNASLGEVTVTVRPPAYSARSVTNMQTLSARDLTKSACCNLAESFETNAAVEVSTADAVSGAKQIQLLGLDGAYSLLTIDNQPALRGLSAPYRLGYLAGPWIESIDIIKGTGSVVNGYEGISGQVNVQLKEPDKTDQLLLNAYANDLGKFDLNAISSVRLTPKWSNVLLLHNDHLGNRVDRNGDGFLDLPLATQFNGYDKVKYKSGGLVAELGVGALHETRQGGQVGFREDAPDAYRAAYGTTQTTTRYTAQARTSYTWPGRPFQSLGLLANGTSHDFASTYSFQQAAGPRQYDGHQNTGQATLLFQSVIGNTMHTYRAGLSFLYDDYRERLSIGAPEVVAARQDRLRTERVPGAFAEYTYNNAHNLTAVLGLRTDHHNLYGWQITPRFNLKYDVAPATSLRLSGGSGFRVPNPIADNASLLASARGFYIGPNIRPEKAWNVGGSFTQYFQLLGRQATFVADYYSTIFQNQLVADMYTTPEFVILDNLEPGTRSFARSFQAEVQAEPAKGLQVKAAYKWLDVQSTYGGNQLLPKPLTPQNRGFLNLGYATAFDKWRGDLTVQWFGERPLAHLPADGVGGGHQHGTGTAGLEYAPRYALLNAQITRAFKRLEVYAGVENLTNYRQPDPIQNAATPFSAGFDAAMVWGPVYGRLTYAGLRYRIE
ncbi:TonB-dependent receptor plug domain-containing protein [Hymenobacter sp. HMF4947]|uniref:TonB-dependent receptor plug domain-containing protein n=1 Tax=Hymenobacter ginkgonis TaxID=2682976 RepID=A0A7K1TI17_9BACT|nr:TonB-dependent receptor [Hymenobacter ginkgonis]MVN78060.1 TonB-dependent receptor plug domain-containing protein [Hymenobacter ginkgonis]